MGSTITRKPDTIKEVFSDYDRCQKTLEHAQQLYLDMNTTREQYTEMQKALSIMYLHCPVELLAHVRLAIEEAEIRRSYFAVYKWVN